MNEVCQKSSRNQHKRLVLVNQFSFLNQHSLGVSNPSGDSGLPSNFNFLFQLAVTLKAQ